MRHDLDHIDEQIIKLLHANARIPLKTIASQVFLSSPAVSARIERLEQAGIITGYSAKINPAELGYHIKAFINLEVNPDQKKEFYPYIKDATTLLNVTALPVIMPCLLRLCLKALKSLTIL